MNKYFHTYIQKYQDELDKYEPTVELKNGVYISKREEKFDELLPDIKKSVKFPGTFILVSVNNNWMTPKKIVLCHNVFVIDYFADRYASRIRIRLPDVLNNNMINVTTNSKILKAYDKDVKLLTIINDKIEYKEGEDNEKETKV